MEFELGALIGVGMLVVVVAAAVVGPRVRIPAPLILVLVGIGLSSLPFVPDVHLPAELVLTLILPPLLFSSSVALPTMDLRREFGTVSMLSVVLVVVTSLVLGGVFTLLIPGLPYALGVALGAVISPTDAVATSIVKGTTITRRVTAILEGESLLNDASALVLLRTAIAGASTAVSIPFVIGEFAYSVVAAVLIGAVVGKVAVALSARAMPAAAGTLLSFAVPFVAAVPAEFAKASGLVAAVTAGLVIGRNGPYRTPPLQRISNAQNWRTVSLALEGAVFLLMGLQISALLADAGGVSAGWRALGLGAVALAVVLGLRAVFVVPLLLAIRGKTRLAPRSRERFEALQQRLDTAPPDGARRRRPPRPEQRQRFRRRIQQALADIDYLAASPLGPKEGAVVVWAGMRGAVTVAAAQTITGASGRAEPLLVLIAFAVAATSLLVQGATLDPVIRLLKPSRDDPAAVADERARLKGLVREASERVERTDGEPRRQVRLRQLRASRAVLLEARDIGSFDAGLLGQVLTTIDASEVALEMQSGPEG